MAKTLEQMPHGRRAFTLIELLVVIAIIAILAAIVFPVFSQTRRKAHQADCLSNLKQISLCLAMYADDWRAYPLHSFKEMGIPSYRWMNTTQSYHSNAALLFQCKTAARQPPGFADSAQVYGYNWQYLGNGRSRTENPPVPYLVASPAAIEAPARTIAVGDSGGLANLVGTAAEQRSGYALDPPVPSAGFGAFYGGSDPSARAVPVARHAGRVNVAFCDGHAAALRLAELEADSSYWNGRADPNP